MGINIGALIAPLVVGTLGQEYNYHLGFSVAAVGMFFGLLQYYFQGRKSLAGIGQAPTNQCLKKSKRNLLKHLCWQLSLLYLFWWRLCHRTFNN